MEDFRILDSGMDVILVKRKEPFHPVKAVGFFLFIALWLRVGWLVFVGW